MDVPVLPAWRKIGPFQARADMAQKPQPEYEDRRRMNIIVLLGVIALVGFTSWLLIEFREGTKLLDCYAFGGKNCNSIIVWPPARS
jgi:hypothetical protein